MADDPGNNSVTNTASDDSPLVPQKNHTDVMHLVTNARDVFDKATWGKPEHESANGVVDNDADGLTGSADMDFDVDQDPSEQAEYIELHEMVEHEPDDEVKPFIEQRHTKIDIPEDLQALGVQATHAVQYPKADKIKVPLSDDKIAFGLKQPLDSAIRWLAEVCKRIFNKAHVRLVVAHGKAQRMFEM